MSQAKRDWSAFDYKSWDLVTSPSAMETADDCIRKWWFLKVCRLKEPQKDFTQLGDVFHEVAERWLEADDTGRDADGNAVDVFPEGWADRLSFGQEATVRALFKAMVDEGILRRTPGRQIEKSFQIQVLPDNQASVVGFADVWTPQGIEDHKTSKSRRYLQTREGLLQNIQMMVYGAAWIHDLLTHTPERLPEKMELRHNQGVTDPDDLYVRPTSVDVSTEAVIHFWETKVIPLVKRMLYWKKAGHPADSWAKLPNPTRKGVCRKYGGCPFAGICGRTESVDEYKERVQLHNEQFEINKAKEHQMSQDLLAKLAEKRKNRASAPAAELTPPTQPAAPSTPATPASPPSSEVPVTAPWADPSCKACQGSGLASNGGPCRPCELSAKKRGILASDFQLEAIEGAIRVCRGDVLVAQVPVTSAVTARDNTKPVAAPKEKALAKAAPPAESPARPSKAEQADDGKAKRGRPGKGFTLLYGVVKRGKGTPIDLQQILQQYGALLANEWNGASYWTLDPFKRREALAHKAQEIAEGFGTSVVMCSSDQRDLLDFAAALEPFAGTVMVAGSR